MQELKEEEGVAAEKEWQVKTKASAAPPIYSKLQVITAVDTYQFTHVARVDSNRRRPRRPLRA